MCWFVYIIETKSGKLYAGITTDVSRRFQEHKNLKTKGAKFFRTDPPRKMVYQETTANRSEALKREAQIKKLTRKEKLQLIYLAPKNRGNESFAP